LRSGSAKLEEALTLIRALAARREVGKSTRTELEEIAAAIAPYREPLAEIEGRYVIDYEDDVDSKIGQAAQLWAAADTGWIGKDRLRDIRKASPLLSHLYLNGVDIERAFKFDEVQQRICAWFGANIETQAGLLRGMRKEKPSRERPGEWSMLVPMSRKVADGLNFLKEQGVLQGKAVLVRNKDNKWTKLNWEWLRDDPAAQLLVIYTKLDNALAHMLTGEWLNSYVWQIIDDQLRRHEIPFELYTQVVYKTKPDIIRSASDFDVIGRIRDTVICVECKSGRLDAERGQFAEIVQRTQDVRHVLSSMNSGEVQFLFYVVYDAELNPSEEMRAQLEPHDIRPLRLNEVRSVIARALASAVD